MYPYCIVLPYIYIHRYERNAHVCNMHTRCAHGHTQQGGGEEGDLRVKGSVLQPLDSQSGDQYGNPGWAK